MDATSSRWQAITDSEFPWERDALAFVRDRLPDHDPYRVRSNFEFIADDGSINEVDLLVLTPKGSTWSRSRAARESWKAIRERGRGGARTTTARTRSTNPLLLANRKAKKLISLLRRQPSLQRKTSTPFLETHVFLSHEAVDCRIAPERRGCRSDRTSTRFSGMRAGSCAGNRMRPADRAPTGRRSAGS